MHTSVEGIVADLRQAKRTGRACSLLIGAGCSFTAGIPLASGFVELIKKDWPDRYNRTEPKTYPALMAALPDGFRRDLVAEKIDNAKINWAHIAIAQLMKNGYVDRVLTTNFDPLVVRACALVGEFPAVYDFAASQSFRPAYVPQKAVFHLHGQRDGFALLHTEKQVSDHSRNLAPLFQDAGRGRMWLVVGYSGDNDPVFEHLAEVDRFDYGLTWVRYEDGEPPKHIRDGLLNDDKGVRYLPNYDADRFFVELAQQLDCFPPTFVDAPFDHLRDILGRVAPFELPNKAGQLDFIERARARIAFAENGAEEAITPLRKRVTTALLSGHYEEAITDIDEGALAHDESLCKDVASAYFILATREMTSAASAKDGDAERIYSSAHGKFEAALRLKPDMHEALSNWGLALADQAQTRQGAEADALFERAGQKYDAALRIKPDMHEALYNWGATLVNQAIRSSEPKRENLLRMARKKLLASEQIRLGSAAYNLACVESLLGNSEECRHWLSVYLSSPTPAKLANVERDPDFDPVRHLPWFKTLTSGALASA